MENYLAFLKELYELTHEKKTIFSLKDLILKYHLTRVLKVPLALYRLGIVEYSRVHYGKCAYFWTCINQPDLELSISLDKMVKQIAKEYYLAKRSKRQNKSKGIKKTISTHIASVNKYLIPFSANDLRYVNTIEEGIELISSAVVAAGDYNIYQLVSKVQKVSKIKVTPVINK